MEYFIGMVRFAIKHDGTITWFVKDYVPYFDNENMAMTTSTVTSVVAAAKRRTAAR